MTLVKSMNLRDALKSIARHAFESNPYPVILSIENHVVDQQQMMAAIFEEMLGEKLYIPSSESLKKSLPSPNQLKGKILLRSRVDRNQDDEIGNGKVNQTTTAMAHAHFKRLVSLPSVKFGQNLYEDAQKHLPNASPSISENKVETHFVAGSPLHTYTISHLVKSYPKSIRQDSSNMDPIPALLSGIQAVAMNFQTAGKNLDLINGVFTINGNVGYVLKSEILLDGRDPRHCCTNVKATLGIAILSGHYLPKPKAEARKGCADPYVNVEIFGIHADSKRFTTKIVKNNGLNPVWKEEFRFSLHCPEVAILRFSVKDFDPVTSDDFLGEFSIPVGSLRSGYSIVRLNTGADHSPDDVASIFVRIAIA